MDQVVLGKIGISSLLFVFQLLLFFNKKLIQNFKNLNQNFSFLIIFLFFRIIPFVFFYFFLGFETRSDVPIFYDAARVAIHGGLVFKDFQTVYSPLFPYLTGLILPFWDSSKAIVLILILLEGVFVWTTNLLFCSRINIFKTLVYFSLPSAFIFSILGGQEDILMWGFLSIILLVLSPNKNFILLGVLIGFALLLTKFIFVLIIPAIIFYDKNWRNQAKVLVGLLIVGVPTFLILYFNSKWAFLGPISEANIPRTPNIWSFFYAISGGLTPLGPKYLNWLGLVSIEALVYFLLIKFKIKVEFQKFIVVCFSLIYIWLMLVQQSSYSNYAYAYLLVLVFALEWQNLKEYIIFVIINFIFAIQPAIWWRNGLVRIGSLEELQDPLKCTLFLMEFILLVGMLWLMKKLFIKFSTL